MDPFGTTSPYGYLSGLPGFATTGVTGLVPVVGPSGSTNSGAGTTSATTTGPKFSTLLLALGGVGILTWITGPRFGLWVPVIALGMYGGAQSGFVNNLLSGGIGNLDGSTVAANNPVPGLNNLFSQVFSAAGVNY